ncbi:MAG: glycosyltransferase, partial [Candidatus Saccharimonadales bacterium]
LRQHISEVELTIIGDGPARNELETLSAKLNAPVDFRGALTNSAVRDEINQARVICLPSIRANNGDAEGFGIVLLEAQACGVPVISSAFGGAQEGIHNGATGFSFNEADEAALFRHLHCLLSDSVTLLKMSVNATAFVKHNFDLHQLTQDLESHYDKILESTLISKK